MKESELDDLIARLLNLSRETRPKACAKLLCEFIPSNAVQCSLPYIYIYIINIHERGKKEDNRAHL